jgi:hypothetical protein
MKTLQCEVRGRWRGLAACVALLLMTGCSGLDVRTGSPAVGEGKTTAVMARLRGASDGTEVTFRVSDGQECGNVSPGSAKTVGELATVNFTGFTGVEDCLATIEAKGDGRTSKVSMYVNKQPLTKTKIDGVSVLVLFLIASFAVDQIVRAVIFVLNFFGFWRKLVARAPDEPPNLAVSRKQQLAYMLMAGFLAIVVLGWFGKVRMLAALGFGQVNPIIDTLFTGLLLVGGAARMDALMQKMGAGAGSDAERVSSTPVEITGRVILEDSKTSDKSAPER